jgi:hypothetical protein
LYRSWRVFNQQQQMKKTGLMIDPEVWILHGILFGICSCFITPQRELSSDATGWMPSPSRRLLLNRNKDERRLYNTTMRNKDNHLIS